MCMESNTKCSSNKSLSYELYLRIQMMNWNIVVKLLLYNIGNEAQTFMNKNIITHIIVICEIIIFFNQII